MSSKDTKIVLDKIFKVHKTQIANGFEERKLYGN